MPRQPVSPPPGAASGGKRRRSPASQALKSGALDAVRNKRIRRTPSVSTKGSSSSAARPSSLLVNVPARRPHPHTQCTAADALNLGYHTESDDAGSDEDAGTPSAGRSAGAPLVRRKFTKFSILGSPNSCSESEEGRLPTVSEQLLPDVPRARPIPPSPITNDVAILDRNNKRSLLDSDIRIDEGETPAAHSDEDKDSYQANADDVQRQHEETNILCRPQSPNGNDTELMRTLAFQKRYSQELQAKRAIETGTGLPLDASQFNNVRELWELECTRIPDNFFTSNEAKLQASFGHTIQTTGKKVKKFYKGLRVTHHNNQDMAYIYRTKYRPIESGNPTNNDTYGTFRTCIGQFVRFAVSMSILELEDVWKEGAIFGLCSKLPLFDAFLYHFQVEAADGTLMNKATLLGSLVNKSIDYYRTQEEPSSDPVVQQERNRRHARSLEVKSKLLNVASAGKKGARLNKAFSRTTSRRKEDLKHISEADIENFRVHAIAQLDGLLGTVRAKFDDNLAADADYTTKKSLAEQVLTRPLLDKWCMNLLVLCLLYGNGQRNQVYCCLVAPHASDLELFSARDGGALADVPLKVEIGGIEKTRRDFMVPDMMFDPVIFPYIHFQVKYVLPVLHSKFEVPLANRNWLLLHSRSGAQLKSDNVRKTIQTWVRSRDPELNVTVMDIRSVYATFMCKKFAQAQRDPSSHRYLTKMTKPQFLDLLAAVMNTGAEQIGRVYSEADSGDFANVAAKFLNIISTDTAKARLVSEVAPLL